MHDERLERALNVLLGVTQLMISKETVQKCYEGEMFRIFYRI